MTDDPFANVEPTGGAATATKETPKKAPAKKAAPVEDAVDPVAAFLAEMSAMTIDDEDFKAPAPYVPNYIRPADNAWVPVRITEAKVEERATKLVVAYTEKGEMVTNPAGIDALVEKGAKEEIEEVTIYQFVVEAEHASGTYGERNFPYRIFTPVFPVRIPLNKPRKRGGREELGWNKVSGKKLLAATRVVKPGMRIEEDKEKLDELAEAMKANGGALVMAKVKHRKKVTKEPVPRKDSSGRFIKAKAGDDGTVVRLTKNGDSFFYKDGGDAYEGSAAGLIPFGDDFLIPDSSDDAAIVKDVEERTNTFDNLAEDVYSMPGRAVTVVRNEDEEEIEATVTMETVGFIAENPIKAGTLIQAVAEIDGKEQTLTASWLGTHWQETNVPHELSVNEAGEVRLLPIIREGSVDPASYDVFKGDKA